MIPQHTKNSFNLVDPEEQLLVCILNTLVRSQRRFLDLKNLFDYPSIVGLGEIGRDRTVPEKLWRQQEEDFCQVLYLVRQDKVLIRMTSKTLNECARTMYAYPADIMWIHSSNSCLLLYGRYLQNWQSNYSNIYSLVLLRISVLIKLLAYSHSQFL